MQTRVVLALLPLLASIGFYNYHEMFSPQIVRLMTVLFVVIAAVYAWMNPIKGARLSAYPRLPWVLLLGSIAISVTMATIIHQQPLIMTAISTLPFLAAYGYFIVLVNLNPDPDKMIKGLFGILAVSVIVYFVNLRSFPVTVFGQEVAGDDTRGMLRVPIPMNQVLVLIFFYCINRFKLDNKKIWIACIALCCMMIVLSVIRQLILICFLLGFIQYMARYSIVKKVIIGSAIAVAGYTAFTHLPFYKDMMELSEEQYEDATVNDQEDVRIGAWRYFAYEAQQEYPAAIPFGNGIVTLGDNPAKWGTDMQAFMESTGYLYADVSWAAMIYHFGIIATLALLYILVAAAIRKKDPGRSYLTYYVISAFLLGIASGVWEYSYDIMPIMLGLYLIYAPRREEATAGADEATPAPATARKAAGFVIN